MPFKSDTQPLCRYCGCPIKKHTLTVLFGRDRQYDDNWTTERTEKPATLVDAQRIINMRIVSNTRSMDRSYVDKVTVWDGESYQDEFFCKGEHAQRFGYAAARGGQAMREYNDAVAARRRRG